MKINKHSLHILLVFLLGLCAGFVLRGAIGQGVHLNAHDVVVSTQGKELDALPIFGQVLQRDGFTIIYDAERKNPRCVIETLTAESLQGSADREGQPFREDEEVPGHLRATLVDYGSSGYDRGHMIPAANCRKSVERIAESFFLSNVCPQDAGLNRGYWLTFERHVRDLTKHFETVQVITGPLYLPEGEPGERFVHYRCIGGNDVAVPNAFFKVLRLEKEGGGIEERAYIMPNEHIAPETPFGAFQVTVQKVERLSGILFQVNLAPY